MKNHQRLLTACIVTLLASCAAPSKVTRQAPVQAPITQEKAEPVRSTEYYLTQAQSAPASLQPSWLLKAADSLPAEDCEKKLQIIELLNDKIADPSDLTLHALIGAECSMNTAPAEKIQALLDKTLYQQGYDQRIFAAQSRFLAKQSRWLDAATAWLKAGIAEPDKSNQVWDWLSQSSDEALNQASLSLSALAPYVELERLIRSDLHRPIPLQQGLQRWQQRFGANGVNWPLPQALERGLLTTGFQPQHLAVVLPLSGKLAKQGKAVKDGLIAAYYRSTEEDKPQLSFIDSVADGEAQLPRLLSDDTRPVDFVIGPLLKGDIAPIKALLPETVPMLALNVPAQTQAVEGARNHFYYGLTPEDEAEQLAQQLLQQGKQMPVMLVANTPTFRRMAERFNQVWLASTDIPLEQRTFTDNKSMRAQVASLLDVDDSRDRIKQIEGLLRQEVFSFSRNRRDIDAIVTFANRQQTELLNPMIEASISPFADIVPVFASSRSFSLSMNKNSVRDLRNLSFIDMPWMLPDNPAAQLMNTSQQLWPARDDNDLRLFALGFDAYNLVGKLAHMRLTTALKHQGLTGELSLGEGQLIKRSLPWGQVLQQGVVNLAMD